MTNTGSSPINNLLFTFVVTAGDLRVTCSPGPIGSFCGTGGSAAYIVNVDIDGVPVSGGHSDATLTMSPTGVSTLTQTPFFFSPSTFTTFGPGDAALTWGDIVTTLPLPTLGPGETQTFDYDLITMATGDFTRFLDVHCFVDPNGGPSVCVVVTGLGGSEARSGDSSGLDPISPGVVVPEPSTLALLVAACLGFATRQWRLRATG